MDSHSDTTSTDWIYAVGDIHGMASELDRVLLRIFSHSLSYGSGRPRIVFLGDLINRGPDSKKVVDLLSGGSLSDRADITVLKGNHELATVRAARDWSTCESWLHNGLADTIESYGVVIGGKPPKKFLREFFNEALPKEHLLWMDNLPTHLRIGRNFFAHAGIDPRYPLWDQKVGDLLCIREKFLGHQGPYPEDVRVIHGHTPEKEVYVSRSRVGVDTGCGLSRRGPLSAVAILGEKVEVL